MTYNTALTAAQQLVSTQEAAVASAIAALNVDGLKIAYDTAYAFATQAADAALAAQQLIVDGAQATLDSAKAAVLAAQQLSGGEAALQTCFDTTNALFLTAQTTGVDLGIYTAANTAAQGQLLAAQGAASSIATL